MFVMLFYLVDADEFPSETSMLGLVLAGLFIPIFKKHQQQQAEQSTKRRVYESVRIQYKSDYD